ncbi:uroporphyrinogen-III synthase [Psychrobacter sp. SWN149]|uniref:uroporphyrinogen-III synthase n=1 Tax=Psychrobacter sp. SWN149 TaxID=2792057 RepID=UPI0018CE293A|nr:uroporphyrinogen-III synthase [Psychrobacter sp. SWN149]MBH0005418.1 uroporphyrinogen-III synthase [Psychrobacter sp. SWN149]
MSSMSTHTTSIHSDTSTDTPSSVPKIVINTRPLARAAALTEYLQAAGMTVVEIPMLALQSRPTTDSDMAIMRQWLAGEYKALVIISPTAAAAGLAVWQSLKHHVQANNDERVETDCQVLQPPSPLIAVGTATAAVLSQSDISVIASYQILQPTVANNEGMLAMPEIEDLQAGDKLLIWRGLGGRRLLVDTLEARGVHIDSIAWYERSMPSDAATQYQQWQQQFLAGDAVSGVAAPQRPKPIVIVSSGVAFEHWTTTVKEAQTQAIEPAPATSLAMDSHTENGIYTVTDTQHSTQLILSDFSYVVLGERLANIVAAQHLNHWRVEDLALDTILCAITSET